MNREIAHLAETFFIGTLVEAKLYGQPVKGLADAVSSRVASATEPQMVAAAERIIRARNSGAFPKLPECLEAINACKPADWHQPRSGARREAITRLNYFDEADAFARGRGRWREISEKADAVEWAEWLAYFDQIGLRYFPGAMRSGQCRGISAPALRPAEFDSAFLGVPPKPELASQERTQSVADGMAALSQAMVSRGTDVKPRDRKMTPDQVDAWIARTKADASITAPPKLSPGLRAKIGLADRMAPETAKELVG